jgi:hypothetical protein
MREIEVEKELSRRMIGNEDPSLQLEVLFNLFLVFLVILIKPLALDSTMADRTREPTSFEIPYRPF